MDSQSLDQVFAHIDQDNSGTLDPQELAELMKQAGVSVSPEDILEMIKMADTNGDGVIDLAEFRRLMANF
jgi:Ca2+-binding EF-hand superfamily protein